MSVDSELGGHGARACRWMRWTWVSWASRWGCPCLSGDAHVPVEMKEEALLDLRLCRRRRDSVAGAGGRPAHPHTPHGRLMYASDLPSRRLAAMQGNLVPVTFALLVYLTDHRPGCGLDITKGPPLCREQPTSPATAGMRQRKKLEGKGIYFKRWVTCILYAPSKSLGAGALLK